MAALNALRLTLRGLVTPKVTQSIRNNALLMPDKASRVQLSHEPDMFRHLHTSVLLERFQRPPLLTPDDVDWSKMESLNSPYKHSFDPDLVGHLLDNMDNDMPVSEMPDPFEKNYRRCFLCRNDVHLDHKNVRLLSQFVSPHTGRIYGRAITGLCIPMQKRVAALIKRARMSGLMPFIFKDPKYLRDPQPYDMMSKKN